MKTMKPFHLLFLCFIFLHSPVTWAVDIGAHHYTPLPTLQMDVDGRYERIQGYAFQNFTLNVKVEANTQSGVPVDWWLVAQVGELLFSYQFDTQLQQFYWREGVHALAQTPLQSFPRTPLIPLSLPAGDFRLYFGLDTEADGQLSGSLRFSTLEMNIQALQRIFYVSPQGDDNHPGTLAQPWRSPEKAAQTAQAGDLILFRGGTYRSQLTPVNSGNAAYPIIFASHPGETAVFNGNSVNLVKGPGAPFSSLILVNNLSHIWLMGLKVQGSQDAGILVYNSNNILLQDNYVYDSHDAGIAVWRSQNFSVDGNEVQLANNGSGTEQENISIGEDAQDFEIRYNKIHEGGGVRGHNALSIKDGSRNGLIHHNEITDIPNNSCLYLDAWNALVDNISIYQNRLHDCHYHGIALAGERGGTVSNISIYNNLIYQNNYGLHLGNGYTSPMENIQIYNNTFYDNGPGNVYGGSIVLRNSEANQVVVRNNLMASDDVQLQKLRDASRLTVEHNLFSHEDKTSSNGEMHGDNFILADPLFVNANQLDLRLQAGSPAIAQGSAATVPVDDFDGQVR
ncbi:right-handed parallel beta-helix repeat-containing protein [Candidatus Venteria ishoeyi]|uniref:Right handed beta helix domain-containing protein n=1 Tax=Candidatus Venteria ishoeyi TaxID=1899563 RepID=A0A1H6FBM2_9GAMM|nr:right-handed parallel beta-helix repeat-containing protein [Candidatus Venteria ishoeyi]MDM8547357.1 right-handed parallel beta-helix repeat-containing protein [Candidatus Venteria ishoeyi]SEH07500.1 Uncharacterised protein [Candidatus Venteria ishoeyi]